MASCFTKTESLVYNVIVAWKEKVVAYITRGDQLIEFEFSWVTFPDHVPVLAGDQGTMLHRLDRYG